MSAPEKSTQFTTFDWPSASAWWGFNSHFDLSGFPVAQYHCMDVMQ